MFRAIPVTNCKACPHKHDWSSQGLHCYKSDPPRLIARSNDEREASGKETPKWCPLPLVNYE